MTANGLPTDELRALADAACDGALRPGDATRLEELLRGNSAAKRFYLACVRLDGCLRWEFGQGQTSSVPVDPSEAGVPAPGVAAAVEPGVGEAVELAHQLDGPESESLIPPIIIDTSSAFFPAPAVFPFSVGGWLFSYAAATVITGMAILGAWAYRVSLDSTFGHEQARLAPSGIEPRPEYVGRVTGMADCRWAGPGPAPVGSDAVPLGGKYALVSGLMEITYQTGAKVILEGPCSYEVESPSRGFLSLGKLTARVGRSEVRGQGSEDSPLATSHQPLATTSNPQSLISNPLFSVRTPTAIVTDLGTEFGVEVDESGATRSHVFRGAVAVRPMMGLVGHLQEGVPITVRESESLLVEPRGSEGAELHATVSRKAAEPARFVRSMPLPERPSAIRALAHFRLGEDDPGAAAGKPAGHETVNRAGPWRLERHGSPSYTADTAVPGSTLAMNFTGAERECFSSLDVHASVMDNFILEAWVRPNRPPRWPTYVVYNGFAEFNGYGLLLGEEGWFCLRGALSYGQTGVPCEPGKWTHVALVCEKRDVQFWVNGRLAKDFGNDFPPMLPTGAFSIGGAPETVASDAYSFDGQIDEVRLSQFRGPFRPEMLLLTPPGGENKGVQSVKK